VGVKEMSHVSLKRMKMFPDGTNSIADSDGIVFRIADQNAAPIIDANVRTARIRRMERVNESLYQI